jgi:hypothetical protein
VLAEETATFQKNSIINSSTRFHQKVRYPRVQKEIFVGSMAQDNINHIKNFQISYDWLLLLLQELTNIKI